MKFKFDVHQHYNPAEISWASLKPLF